MSRGRASSVNCKLAGEDELQVSGLERLLLYVRKSRLYIDIQSKHNFCALPWSSFICLNR